MCGIISFKLVVSHQSGTVILCDSHWSSVTCTSGEIQEVVVADVVVRQRAKSLKLRRREEGVTFIL